MTISLLMFSLVSYVAMHQAEALDCDSLFRHSSGQSCYFFSTLSVFQPDAVVYCQDLGAHLVYIETAAEQAAIVGWLPTIGDIQPEYWIGLTGTSPENARWLNGEPPTYTSYEFFPLYSFDGATGYMRLRRPYYYWHDAVAAQRFICEKEMPVGAGNMTESKDTFVVRQRGDRVIVPVLVDTIKVSSVIKCGLLCGSHQLCDSFVHGAREGTCHLVNEDDTTSVGGVLLTGRELAYYKRQLIPL